MPSISITEAASMLGISRPCIYEWLKKGKISRDEHGGIDTSEVFRLQSLTGRKTVSKTSEYQKLDVKKTSDDCKDACLEIQLVLQKNTYLKARISDLEKREGILQAQVERLMFMLEQGFRALPPASTNVKPQRDSNGRFMKKTH